MKTLLATFVAILVTPPTMNANPLPKESSVATEDAVVVKTFASHSNSKSTHIDFFTDKPLGAPTVAIEDHETFLQISLQPATISNPGEFIDIESPHVKKIVGFQSSPDKVDLRVIVDKEADIVKQAATTSVDANKLRVTIDDLKVHELLQNHPKHTAKSPTTPSAEEMVATTSVSKSLPEPAAQLKQVNESAATSEARQAKGELKFLDTGNINKRLQSAALFCLIMLSGLMFVWILKPRLKRLRPMPNDYSGIVMKTLSTHKVSPKQRLELIDVGGEKILIAISPDQVTFLTAMNQGALAQPLTTSTALPNLNKSAATAAPRTLNTATASGAKQLTGASTVKTQSSNTTAAAPKRRVIVQPTATKSSARPVATAAAGQRINAKVGDEITMNYSRNAPTQNPVNNKSISDVTQMIREKLKNLPSI